MSVIRVQHTEKYVIINKVALEDPRLSFKAKGVWAYCMSRPNDWKFHVSHLATISKEKERAIYSALDELMAAGYCQKIQPNKGRGEGGGRGCFGNVEYVIYEEPQEEIQKIFTLRRFAVAENADAQKDALLRKERHKGKIDTNPPPPSSNPDPKIPPTTKEEEEELKKRLRERPKNAQKIKNMSRWREKVLEEIRREAAANEGCLEAIAKHKQEAKGHDGIKIGGDMVTACKDHVEFTCGTWSQTIPYNLPDDSWKKLTERWFGKFR